MPPGPALGVLLGGIDRSRLAGDDAVTLMVLRARQVAYDQAQLLADVAEVGVCETISLAEQMRRAARPGEFAADEIAAALTWTVHAASSHLVLGWMMWSDHPALGAAMAAGELDLPRATIICDELGGLDTDTAASVVAAILPKAAGLTTGRLRAALTKLIQSIDPGAAKRRYDKGVADRLVEHFLQHNATATLGGWMLPAERAAAAAERLWGWPPP